jgi:hypothetical protein
VIRLFLVVEGRTEELFVRDVLAPHLAGRAVAATPIQVATARERAGHKYRGGGHWKHWERDLRRLVAEHRGSDVRFSSLFDLYGLPEDFPRLREHAAERDTLRRAELLQAAMAARIDDWRFIPYVQRHEFEALVLASLDGLVGFLDAAGVRGVDELRAALVGAAPEDVNEGESTAPSKRLLRTIPGYQKTLHGPLAVEAAGLASIRARCPRFDAWVGVLERLTG